MDFKKEHGSDWQGLLNAALEISRKRNDILQRMKTALENEQDAEALKLAKELFGIGDEHSRN